ncbi:long-chain fatty acid--CoA ligase [Prolixibacteraceae bacterium JC049]|nr:long-chain fatty acid--CoA ligase [Prolixibacteraceae bacterium JC049]
MKNGKETLKAEFRKSVEQFGSLPSLAFDGETPATYSELGASVDELSAYLQQIGLKKGDKVGILSGNMPNWARAYFSIIDLGAVAVPMLPDFHPNEIKNIIEHSETKALFVSQALYHKLEELGEDQLEHLFLIDDFRVIAKGSSKEEITQGTSMKASADFKAEDIYVDPEDLASIIYTSGTTGKSKGVMLTHKNLVCNAYAGKEMQLIQPKDRFLSLMPLSHVLEFTVSLVISIISGSSTFYLKKPPTPAVLLPALKRIKPTVMLTVPLIIEKIYRSKVLPTFDKSKVVSFLYHKTPMRKLFHRIAGKKLMETFGGELIFFGIGGAKLDATVEKFLREGKFPYAIGYGMTETAPLLAGAGPVQTKLYATGPKAKGMELRIDNPDPKTGEGEIVVRGTSLMKGYYKEPELTKEAFTEDGWFRTGDLGVFDDNGYLYIKGRLKNMILGASGENIYPEEIESVINNFKGVLESLVIERKGKLVALVHVNIEELADRYEHLKHDILEEMHKCEEQLDDYLKELQAHVNSRVNRFSQLQVVMVQPSPFEKTATHKIKRFLYE